MSSSLSRMNLIVLLVAMLVMPCVAQIPEIYLSTIPVGTPPAGAIIGTPDGITYNLLCDFQGVIKVDKDNIILEGNYKTLRPAAFTAIQVDSRTGVKIQHFILKETEAAISLRSANSNFICDNTFISNKNGISILYSSSNEIYGNTFLSTQGYAIYLNTNWGVQTTGNKIFDNTFGTTTPLEVKNGAGIVLTENNGANAGNFFYNNRFINNVTHVSSSVPGENFFSVTIDGSCVGNSWSGWETDVEAPFGVLDPYVVSPTCIDYCPIGEVPQTQVTPTITFNGTAIPANTDGKLSATVYVEGVEVSDAQVTFSISGSDPISGTFNSETKNYEAAIDPLAVGLYPVTASVLDDQNYKAAMDAGIVAAYDPNGGFVTGGGWIMSPEGAYGENTPSGKATFGFVSKYAENSTVPTGETQFSFNIAGISFYSNTYSWLVIAGYKALYKGIGTLNGQEGYGFLISAIDGAIKGDGVDMFRIKIQELSTGNVVYDNQMDAPENADASTAIGGGSIVIHKSK